MAFAAFAIYGSLVPFKYHSLPWEEALKRFQTILGFDLNVKSRSDWVANILLFVPIGFFSMGALRLDRPRGIRDAAAALLVVPAALLLSLFVEFSQLWFPPRVPSQNDVAAETLGALLGVAIWCLLGRKLTELVRAYTSSRLLGRRLELLLQAYLVGFLIYSVLPLDLTISPADLWRKFRDGKVLLLAIGGHSTEEMAYVVLSKIATFIPVGLLASSTVLKKRSGGEAIRLGLVIGAGLSAAIEFAQLFVLSHVSSAADVLWGAIGVSLGVALRRASDPQSVGRHLPRRLRDRLWMAGTGCYVMILVALFWSPFRFNFDEHLAVERLHQMIRVPFESLFWGTYWNVIAQVTRKLLWFALLGALVARVLVVGATSRRSLRLRIAAGFLSCLLFSALIELGQIFLPGHVPDLTDILLYETGAVLGILVTCQLLIPQVEGWQTPGPFRKS